MLTVVNVNCSLEIRGVLFFYIKTFNLTLDYFNRLSFNLFKEHPILLDSITNLFRIQLLNQATA